MMKRLTIYVSILIIGVLLIGCDFSRVEYTLYFNSNGGNEITSIESDGKSVISIPEEPIKEGFIFSGWYWDNNTFSQPFSANSLIDSPLSSDMTIYANWIVNQYTITFDVDGGIEVDSITQDYNSPILFPNTSKIGHSFTGWYINSDRTTLFDDEYIPAENITLYAKWRISNVTYGGSNSDFFHSIIEDSEGNYVAVGFTSSNDHDITDGNNGFSDALIVKFDTEGNVIWDKTISGSNWDYFHSIIEDSEGNYVAVGYTDSDDYDITDGNNGFRDALIVKFDTEGNVIWDKTIGGSDWDYFSSIIEDNEGNYVAVGFTGSNDYDITDGNNGYADALIVKIDTEGNVIWDKTIGGSKSEHFDSIIEDSEGNYVAVGFTASNDYEITDGNNGFSDALIVKFDTEGNVIWDKTIGGSDTDSFSSIIEDNEGNYVAVGYTSSNNLDINDGNNGSSDALIVKIDTEGNVIWDKTIGGSSYDGLNSIIEDSEGNYVAVGHTSSNDLDITDGNNGSSDALIVKIDTEGNVIWDKTKGGSSYDELNLIIEDSEGNYVAVGLTISNDYDITDGNNGSSDALIWFE